MVSQDFIQKLMRQNAEVSETDYDDPFTRCYSFARVCIQMIPTTLAGRKLQYAWSG